jgi:hypothetical protein
MNLARRLWAFPFRTSNASFSPPTAASGFAHRADSGGAAAASDILTRLAVVLLSGANAVMWWAYTESRVMGVVWAAIAIGFSIWTKREVARR